MRKEPTLTADVQTWTQYATVYDANERPVATLRRRHAFDPKGSPAWEAFDTNGQSLTRFYLVPSVRYMLRRVELMLDIRAKQAERESAPEPKPEPKPTYGQCVDILETPKERRRRMACKPMSDDALQAGRLAALERGDKRLALAMHNEQMTRWARRETAHA